MNPKIITMLLPILLSACLSLPDDNHEAQHHYNLLAAKNSCTITKPYSIRLAITEVAAGLNSDRIIQISTASGEVEYLSQMRWPTETQNMLQQRMAQDLESAGAAIITSHHNSSSIAQLNCELRALNLLADASNQRSAHFALSCTLQQPKSKNHRSFSADGLAIIDQLQADKIAIALSDSYSKGFERLCTELSNN